MSEAACVHIDDAREKLSNPDDHETERSTEWTRDLETISGRVGAGEQRSRGQALEEWERLVRQYEAQNVDTLRDTIKAATLAHNPHDSEWCRCVRLSATRLQEYDALKSMWKEKGKSKRKGKGKSKRKGKERGKNKDKSKEGTSDTSNAKCSFCKGNDRHKSLTWPAEKKTMSHELSKLTMIDSDASMHVCPLNNG